MLNAAFSRSYQPDNNDNDDDENDNDYDYDRATLKTEQIICGRNYFLLFPCYFQSIAACREVIF